MRKLTKKQREKSVQEAVQEASEGLAILERRTRHACAIFCFWLGQSVQEASEGLVILEL